MARGRPPTPLQTWGAIGVTQPRPGAFRARSRVRDDDGITRQVTAMGTTKAAAVRALRAKLVARETPQHHEVTRNVTLNELAEKWLRLLRDEQRLEATTINEYERLLRRVVLPALGKLRLAELSTSRVERFITGLGGEGPSRQRKVKVVLGAMLDLAVRYDALVVNPVRQTSRLRRPKTPTRALTSQELAEVRQAFRDAELVERPGPREGPDLSDMFEIMLATGARIGEVLALRWCDVELDQAPPTVSISGTVKSEPGRSAYRKDTPKTDSGVRTLVLPSFAVAVLRRRVCENPSTEIDAVFATRNGTWHQVGNIERRWRRVRRGTELEWVTPHVVRKTVATWISEQVDAETASKQLGHSSSAITREFYIAKPAIAADVAHVLEELGSGADGGTKPTAPDDL